MIGHFPLKYKESLEVHDPTGGAPLVRLQTYSAFVHRDEAPLALTDGCGIRTLSLEHPPIKVGFPGGYVVFSEQTVPIMERISQTVPHS